jgi:autotransporter-associated beta strand protein
MKKLLPQFVLFNNPQTKKLFIAVLFLFTSFGYAQTTYDWLNSAPDGNWRQGASGARWSGGLFDQPSSGAINLRFNNNNFTTMTNNVSGTYNIYGINFGSFATSSRTISGNNIRLFDASGVDPKIQNDATASHTINLNMEADGDAADPLEINPVNGNLILNGTLQLYNSDINVFGDNFKKLTLGGVVTGSGKLIVKQNNIVVLDAINTYTGNTELDKGEVWINTTGNAIDNNNIFIGNGGITANVAKIFLSRNSGGTNFTRNITINNGNLSTRFIGALNTSGTNEFSGTITNNSTNGLTVEVIDAGGTLRCSNVISGSSFISKIGNGILEFSGTAKTYTGTTIVNSGTLRLGAANQIADASNLQANGGIFSSGSSVGYSETMGTIQLTENSFIDLGTGSHTLTFANSSAVGWTGSKTLVITGWSGSCAGRIFIGTTSGGLTSGQLAQITFQGYPAGAVLTSAGELLPYTNATTASVSIAAVPSGAICPGTSVTFTATPTNGGSTPIYQWKVNGTNDGTNSQTFTTTTLINGDVVTVVMTSNANACLSAAPVTSTGITMTVNPTLTAAVTIAALPAGAVCTGTNVTFTATPTNGGASPTYQWTKNGTNISGAINATYIGSAGTDFVSTDVIRCVLTSNATPCLTGSPVTSAGITMTVNPTLTAAVTIAALPAGAVCTGTSVTFTATPTNGGATPTYQWTKNGIDISGAINASYTGSAGTDFVSTDVIRCVLTSNATPCLTGSPVTSTGITMTVNPTLTAAVTIAALPTGTICPGTSVTFTATPTNGGSTPAYQWKVNGTNAGTNSPTFTTTALTNGQVVTVEMTSNAACASPTPAISAGITMSVSAISGPLSGTYNIPSTCFPTIASAAAALNNFGVSGPVTFNVAAGYTETAIAGGITFLGNGTAGSLATGTVVNPIVFQKFGAGANPTITAFSPQSSGNIMDAVVKIVGSDYLTFDSFTLQENATNTTSIAASNNMTEFGFGLFASTGVNGAKNNTIQNCSISLNKTYLNTFGIYSNNMHTSIAPGTAHITPSPGAGISNSNNKIYSNTISNVNLGIVMIGVTGTPTEDSSNDIGGSATSTGNVITNVGNTNFSSGYNGVSQIVCGIQLSNCINGNTRFNTISVSSNSAGGSVHAYGMYLKASTAPTATHTSTISNNTITVTNTGTSNNVYGIWNDMGGSAHTININNNEIKNCTTGTTFTGKFAPIFSSVGLSVINVNSNIISNNTIGGSSLPLQTVLDSRPSLIKITGIITGSITVSSNTCNTNTFNNTSAGDIVAFDVNGNYTGTCAITNNTVDGLTTSGTGSLYGYFNNGTPSGALTINNNTFRNVNITGAGSNSKINFVNSDTGTSQVLNINGNTIENLTVNTATTSSGITGIFTFRSATVTVNNNLIKNLNSLSTNIGIQTSTATGGTTHTVSGNTIDGMSSNAGGGVNHYGIISGPATGTTNIFNNRVYNITTGTSTNAKVYGIEASNGATANVYNNMVGDLKTPNTTNTTSTAIRGITISGAVISNVYNNSVYLTGTSSGTDFSSATFAFSGTTTSDIRNNIFVNNITPKGQGFSAAIMRIATGTNGTIPANFSSTSNNNILFAPTVTNGVIFVEGQYTGGGPTNVIAANCFDLSVYKAFITGGRETATISEIPPFVNIIPTTMDLRLDGAIASGAINGGQTLATVTTDIDGVARPIGGIYEIGADEVAGTTADRIAPVISFTALTDVGCSASIPSLSATITDTNAIGSGANAPRIYYKKLSDVNFNIATANNNSVSGWKFVTTASGASPYSFAFDMTLLPGGLISGDVIQYFVAAQDVSGNVASSNVSINTCPTTVALASTQVVSGAPIINQFTLRTNISGSYNIGTAGDYPNLTGVGGLFDAINRGYVTGNITANIISDIAENGAVGLNQWQEFNASPTCTLKTVPDFTLTVQSNDASIRTISGTNLTYNTTTLPSLINLNGADRVTFTGGTGTERKLVFRSTNATANVCVPVFQIGNGSITIKINNCDIQSNGFSSAVPISAGIYVSAVAGTNNIVIDNNDIHNSIAGTTGNIRFGVYAENNANTLLDVKNNNIYNVTETAIKIGVGGTPTIADNQSVTGNSIYDTNTGGTVFSSYTGIDVRGNATSGFKINNNFIGGRAPLGGVTGAPFTNASITNFKGILLPNSNTTNTNEIKNNVIGNLNFTNTSGVTFSGIDFTGKTECDSNTIGHPTDAAMGVTIGATGATGASNNYGIIGGGGTAVNGINFTNNTVRFLIHRTNGAAITASRLIGIYNSFIGAVATTININGNTIADMTTNMRNTVNLYTTGNAYSTGGIMSGILSSTASNSAIEVNRNKIYNLSNTGFNSTNIPNVIGIAIDGNTPSNITRNQIYNLTNQSPGSATNPGCIFGIRLQPSTSVVANNMITLTNGANTNKSRIIGIFDGANNLDVNYNTVVIGGSQDSFGTNGISSAPYASIATVGSHNIRNNIFQNTRTNTSGTPTGVNYHYALAVTATGSSVISNYNNILAADLARVFLFNTTSYSKALWSALSTPATPDVNSIADVPFFVDVTNGDLHLAPDSNCAIDGKGTPIALTTDFDGDTRNATLPDIGADEFTSTFTLTTVAVPDTTCASPTADLTKAIATASSTTGGTTGYFTNAGATVVYATPTAASAGNYWIKLSKGSCSEIKPVVIGGLTTSTFTAGAWTPANPTVNNIAVIDDDFSFPASTLINSCRCTIAPNRTVSFMGGATLNIVNELNVPGSSSLTFESGASLVQQIETATNTGNITYKRDAIVKQLDYVYWSSPVVGKDVNSIYSGTPAANTLSWLPTAPNSNGSTGNWTGSSGTMPAAKGYAIRVPNSLDPVTASTVTTTFVGVPHNGDYTFGVARGDYNGVDIQGTNSATITANDDNWNLLGNPYPSAIDADAFLLANATVLQGSIDVWTHGTTPSTTIAQPFYGTFGSNYSANDYITYNSLASQAGPATFNGKIAAGQAFFVKMVDGPSAATGTVTFTNALRNVSYDNSQFFRSANSATPSIEKHRIWLDLVSNSTNDVSRIAVGYATGATAQYDRMFDATSDYQSSQSFFSLIDQNIYSIQGRALPFVNTDTIPMGYAVPTAGTYKIGIHAVDGLFANNGQTIYLQDNLTGVVHNLSAAPYSFVATAGANKTRFVLRYTAGVLSNNNNELAANSVIVFKDNTTLKVQSVAEPIDSISVFDILGRNVFTQNKINANSFETSNVVSQQQTLIVKVNLTNGVVVTKKIIM